MQVTIKQKKECEHKNLEYDKEEDYFECKDCGKRWEEQKYNITWTNTDWLGNPFKEDTL